MNKQAFIDQLQPPIGLRTATDFDLYRALTVLEGRIWAHIDEADPELRAAIEAQIETAKTYNVEHWGQREHNRCSD